MNDSLYLRLFCIIEKPRGYHVELIKDNSKIAPLLVRTFLSCLDPICLTSTVEQFCRSVGTAVNPVHPICSNELPEN